MTEIAAWEKIAIKAATEADWKKAACYNQLIIDHDKHNVAALNRLTKALLEQGKFWQAKKICQQLLAFDRYNPIALKNKQKLHTRKKEDCQPSVDEAVCTSDFLVKEPGKSRCIKVVNPATSPILQLLDSGDTLSMVVKKHGITITRKDHVYLGTLPDDVATKLISFIKGGNRYQIYVRSVNGQNLEVFIKETFRSRKFRNLPSF